MTLWLEKVSFLRKRRVVATFNPATANLKKILMKHWHLITGNNTLAQIYSNVPIVAYRKEKSLKDPLVRAKIPPVQQQLLRSYTLQGLSDNIITL